MKTPLAVGVACSASLRYREHVGKGYRREGASLEPTTCEIIRCKSARPGELLLVPTVCGNLLDYEVFCFFVWVFFLLFSSPRRVLEKKEGGVSWRFTMDKLGQLTLDKLSLDKVKNMVGEV